MARSRRTRASAASISPNTTRGSRPAACSVSARSPVPLATHASLILPPRPWSISTLTRTVPVFQGLQRTRLLDPLLSFLGTNDQPGDYRSSGCTACHVVYANDRDAAHSGPYAARGHLGTSFTND